MPELSVIIVNFRSWGSLRQCLDSLSVIPQNHLSFEVIVVDNASNDGKFEEFQAAYPQFAFILNNGNNGFANGCNFGASNAKGEYLLFLNPDTVANEPALTGMLNKASKSGDFLIISCRQIKEYGSEEKPYGSFLTPFTLTGWQRALRRLFLNKNKLSPSTSEVISPDWISGSVVMISKDSFNALKGWDEDYWMYFEDVDLCRRARAAGGDILLMKEVTIEHNHGGASRKDVRTTVLTKCEVNISRHVYFAKHERGLRRVYMQGFLVINNLIAGLIPALLGLILFFIRSLKIASLIYFCLLGYYIRVLYKRTWLSSRSVNYRN